MQLRFGGAPRAFRCAAPAARTTCLAAIALCVCSAAAATARAEDRDPWFAADKSLHLTVSAGISCLTYGVVAWTALDDTGLSPWRTGLSAALVTGVGKELFDNASGGAGSFRDLVFDAVGTVLGLVVAVAIDYLFTDPLPDRPEAPARAAVEADRSSPGLRLRFGP